MPDSSPLPRKRQAAAWGVHIFTLTGIVWACLAMAALLDGRIALMWLWLGIALIVDGLDGTFARKADVKTYAAWFDGSILDIVIDYLTWTFIPAIFMYLYLPFGPKPMALAMLILVTGSSIFCYANTKLKTIDYYFMGFPAAWNVVAIIMWLFATPAWVNILATIILAILTVAPITFVHPFRVKKAMPLNIVASILWFGATVQLTIMHPNPSLVTQIVFWVSGLWIMGVGFVRTVRGRDRLASAKTNDAPVGVQSVQDQDATN